MALKKIVVCDHIHQSGLKLLEEAPDINYINAADETKDKLINEIIVDADVIITRSSTDVDTKLLERAKRLKAIVRAGVGVDNVDINECSKRGIIVMNVPTANTIAAVELTMAHMLSCVRKFPYAHNHLKQQRVWRRQDWYGIELKDKKLGIIGFGNIGSRVGVRAKAFEMDVITYDPYIDPSKATNLDIKYTTNFDDILECDIITIHTPKTEETINMIDKDEIAKMKDGVILINCARGGLYNEEALYSGLKSGKIAMAGIDVFSKEPATDHPLLDLDNVTVTPHLGANTKESQRNIAIQAVEAALNAARGISYPNALNLPIKESELPDFLKPYLELSQKIGNFTSQVIKNSIESIKVTTEGEVSKYIDSLTTFTTVGILNEIFGDQVNYVNAEYIAQDRGIDIIKESTQSLKGFKNLITVKVTASNGEVIEISGTVFEDELQRVVEIDGYSLDLEPKGRLILFKNNDEPGVIGSVGTLIAKYNINISDFRLGRNRESLALAVIKVDSNIPKELIEELSKLPACLSVTAVNL
jgi:D-3-phosphoglycerate dehydrogenase